MKNINAAADQFSQPSPCSEKNATTATLDSSKEKLRSLLLKRKLTALQPFVVAIPDASRRLLPFINQESSIVNWRILEQQRWTSDELLTLRWLRAIWENKATIKPSYIGEIWPMNFKLREAVIRALAADAHCSHLLYQPHENLNRAT